MSGEIIDIIIKCAIGLGIIWPITLFIQLWILFKE